MQIFAHPLPLALFVLFAALHFIPPLFSKSLCKILRYVNIGLHIILYLVLMLCRIPLDEVVLLLLVSLLLYVLSSLLWEKIGRGKEKAGESEEKMP